MGIYAVQHGTNLLILIKKAPGTHPRSLYAVFYD
jgi:hypothetical protein